MNIDVQIERWKERNEAVAQSIEDRIRVSQAAPGSLGLPPLLEERRLKYGIPNGAFKRAAMYDRILVWQVPEWEGETFGDTGIVMPERAKQRVEESAPRGVIVSAGLGALDVLRSNGSDIGHTVAFVRIAPWRIICDMVAGHELHMLVLRVGDLIADEDLQEQLNAGLLSVAKDGVRHWLEGSKAPVTPEIPEEY